MNTPVLPAGWQDRLIEVANENTMGVRGLCLEPHDLVISKLAAGRQKDLEFCDAAFATGLVQLDLLTRRLKETTTLTAKAQRRIAERINRWGASRRRVRGSG